MASVQSHVETSGASLLADLASIGGGRRARENAERRHRHDQENPVFTARAVCLVRRGQPEGPPLVFARPAAPVEPEAPRAVPTVDVQSHLGQRVTLRFADGRHQAGTLAGDDGESVFLRTEGAMLRFPAAQLAAVEPASAP